MDHEVRPALQQSSVLNRVAENLDSVKAEPGVEDTPPPLSSKLSSFRVGKKPAENDSPFSLIRELDHRANWSARNEVVTAVEHKENAQVVRSLVEELLELAVAADPSSAAPSQYQSVESSPEKVPNLSCSNNSLYFSLGNTTDEDSTEGLNSTFVKEEGTPNKENEAPDHTPDSATSKASSTGSVHPFNTTLDPDRTIIHRPPAFDASRLGDDFDGFCSPSKIDFDNRANFSPLARAERETDTFGLGVHLARPRADNILKPSTTGKNPYKTQTTPKSELPPKPVVDPDFLIQFDNPLLVKVSPLGAKVSPVLEPKPEPVEGPITKEEYLLAFETPPSAKNTSTDPIRTTPQPACSDRPGFATVDRKPTVKREPLFVEDQELTGDKTVMADEDFDFESVADPFAKSDKLNFGGDSPPLPVRKEINYDEFDFENVADPFASGSKNLAESPPALPKATSKPKPPPPARVSSSLKPETDSSEAVSASDSDSAPPRPAAHVAKPNKVPPHKAKRSSSKLSSEAELAENLGSQDALDDVPRAVKPQVPQRASATQVPQKASRVAPRIETVCEVAAPSSESEPSSTAEEPPAHQQPSIYEDFDPDKIEDPFGTGNKKMMMDSPPLPRKEIISPKKKQLPKIPVDDDFDPDKVENPFGTKSKIMQSPAKEEEFDFESVADPFGTKSKIKMGESPPLKAAPPNLGQDLSEQPPEDDQFPPPPTPGDEFPPPPPAISNGVHSSSSGSPVECSNPPAEAIAAPQETSSFSTIPAELDGVAISNRNFGTITKSKAQPSKRSKPKDHMRESAPSPVDSANGVDNSSSSESTPSQQIASGGDAAASTSDQDVVRLRETVGRLQQDKARLEEKLRDHEAMIALMSDMEDSFAQLAVLKDKAVKQSDKENVRVIQERDEAMKDLKSVEQSYFDLHKRYTKLQDTMLSYKKNEDYYNQEIVKARAKIAEEQKLYQTLKSHTEHKFNEANADAEARERQMRATIMKLEAEQKKLQMVNQSINMALETKTRENKELNELCEQLIDKFEGGNQ